MKITKVKNDTQLTITLEGRLDSMTAPELESFLENELEGLKHLVFDMNELAYISSAGLRVLLSSSKKMKANGGSMKLINVDNDVEDVLMITGFRRAFMIETKGGHIYNPELF